MTKQFKWLLLLLLQNSVPIFSQSQRCYPGADSLYLYYVNVNLEQVPNDMDKAQFLKLLESASEKKDISTIASTIVKVKKSFPTAQTAFLQHSISVYAKTDSLKEPLSTFKSLFNLVEMLCHPKNMLLFEPNDYAIYPDGKSHLELIKAPQAWNITKGDARIRIGISDSYIETTHEDLSNKIALNWNNHNSPDFHGIAVAGCAAAHTNNGVGISAVGFNSMIAFTDISFIDNEVLLLAQVPKVRVINCSWINSCDFLQTQDVLYREILERYNVIVTAGAGNNRGHCGENALVYPAAYESVVSVTSIGHQFDIGTTLLINGRNMKFNWKDCYLHDIDDPVTHHHNNRAVDICAPGFNVLSTFENNSYSGAWGTSFAAPQVAGVCALVAAVDPCLTGKQVKDIVLNTADPSIYQIDVNRPVIGLLGSGRLDAYQAVKRAMDLGTIFIQNKIYNNLNLTESARTVIKAGYSVTNNTPFGLVTIKPLSDIQFKATQEIVLSGGFSVENNAKFEAKIVQSPCF